MTSSHPTDGVDPARAGVETQHETETPDELGQAERSTATELGETMPLTDEAAESGA